MKDQINPGLSLWLDEKRGPGPAMPLGSPGMEMPDGSKGPFDTLLLMRDGTARVFARHA